ncbi:hypothetical protein B0H10DRAFT_1986956 [Mycena sp. CBHHK59/15]|nr:hypothetical protein B0H10DRAFT_1986956 [Mycena sp. CBHHK59/15]
MSTPNPKQLENAYAFLTHLNALDFDALGELMAPHFTHQYFPGMINPLDGKERRGKESSHPLLGPPDQMVSLHSPNNLLSMFEKVTYGPPLDVIHGVDAVVFHLKSDGMSKLGKKYNNEYMVTFHFEGKKMTSLQEYVDSKYSALYFASLREE